MTEEEYARVRPVIDMSQRLHMSLHSKLLEKGVEAIDAVIAATYATHYLAGAVHGSPAAGVEWMRDVLDTIERQLLEQPRPN